MCHRLKINGTVSSVCADVWVGVSLPPLPPAQIHVRSGLGRFVVSMEPRVLCIYFLHLLWFLQLEPEAFQESSTISGCLCLGAAVSAPTNLWVQSINGLLGHLTLHLIPPG